MIVLSVVIAAILALWGLVSGSSIPVGSKESIPDEWRVHYVKPSSWNALKEKAGDGMLALLVFLVKPWVFFLVAVAVPLLMWWGGTGSWMVAAVGSAVGIVLYINCFFTLGDRQKG